MLEPFELSLALPLHALPFEDTYSMPDITIRSSIFADCLWHHMRCAMASLEPILVCAIWSSLLH
jgi:hypothetical protein